MNTKQSEITVNTNGRNTYETTKPINEKISTSEIDLGIYHIFIQLTSASLIISKNADPDVRTDLETVIQRLLPDTDSEYLHTVKDLDLRAI